MKGGMIAKTIKYTMNFSKIHATDMTNYEFNYKKTKIPIGDWRTNVTRNLWKVKIRMAKHLRKKALWPVIKEAFAQLWNTTSTYQISKSNTESISRDA